MCGSRKYPYPHHGGNWKFQRGGGGGSMAKEIPEGRRGEWLVNFTFMSDIIVQNLNDTNLATS